MVSTQTSKGRAAAHSVTCGRAVNLVRGPCMKCVGTLSSLSCGASSSKPECRDAVDNELAGGWERSGGCDTREDFCQYKDTLRESWSSLADGRRAGSSCMHLAIRSHSDCGHSSGTLRAATKRSAQWLPYQMPQRSPMVRFRSGAFLAWPTASNAVCVCLYQDRGGT